MGDVGEIPSPAATKPKAKLSFKCSKWHSHVPNPVVAEPSDGVGLSLFANSDLLL